MLMTIHGHAQLSAGDHVGRTNTFHCLEEDQAVLNRIRLLRDRLRWPSTPYSVPVATGTTAYSLVSNKLKTNN
jgi:hypothetical protein